MALFDRFRRRPEEETKENGIFAGAQNDSFGTPTGAWTGGMDAAGVPLGILAAEDAAMVQPIGKDQIHEAMNTLRKYKTGKANFERRIIENEQWWKLRHWEHIKERGTTKLQAKSAWLVNVILSKHADAMDAMPEPNCLPRMQDDEDEANILSKVVPVVLQQNNFDLTWSDNWWKKLKAGVAIYGVYWDANALNGLGDIAVRKVDPLSLFWEPGVTDLQASRNVFHVELQDNSVLEETYPQLEGKLGAKAITVNEYIYDDTVDTSDKSPVIDWYYKKKVNGRDVLHYVKFVGDEVLYATENDAGVEITQQTGAAQDTASVMPGGMTPTAQAEGFGAEVQMPDENAPTERGLYDHGLYPFFFDVLFPEEGTPTGYGYIDICKDAQRQIDLMNNAIVANCVAAATPRWLKRGDDGVNEEEYADWTRPFVHVQGSIEDNAMRQITVSPLSGNYLAILESKINEMKETSGNRDVNNGGAPSGVTAASAIAAMQEQSGKLSRDQIQTSYNCYRQIVYAAIELMRQFYDAPRWFRILGPDGAQQFVQFSNRGLIVQTQAVDPILGPVASIRKPVFDIEVNAQRQSAYSKMSQNELALQFYQLGFFNPQMSDQALAALDMMDFRGKEKIRQRVEQNGGMFQMLQQMMAMMQGGAAGGEGPSSGPQGGQSSPGGDKPAKLQETDAAGEQRMQNRYVDAAKAKAQAATQPR